MSNKGRWSVWKNSPYSPGLSGSTGWGEGSRAARGEAQGETESGRQVPESKVIAATGARGRSRWYRDIQRRVGDSVSSTEHSALVCILCPLPRPPTTSGLDAADDSDLCLVRASKEGGSGGFTGRPGGGGSESSVK